MQRSERCHVGSSPAVGTFERGRDMYAIMIKDASDYEQVKQLVEKFSHVVWESDPKYRMIQAETLTEEQRQEIEQDVRVEAIFSVKPTLFSYGAMPPNS